MKLICKDDDKQIEITAMTEFARLMYEIVFREDITPIGNGYCFCNHYTVYSEDKSTDDMTMEEYVEQHKDELIEYAKSQEIILVNENKIKNMKSSLDNTDYKVLRNLENFMIGIPYDTDLASVCANRQLMRDSINNIENSVTNEDDLLEQAKQRKINEVSLISQSMIINGVEHDGKHYRLNTTDQINISALNVMAQMGRKVPYHADGEVCRIFEPEEMIELAQKATSWVVYHTTYFNLLKHQILEYDSIADVNSVYYGSKLKDEYQTIIDTIIAGEGEANA